MGPGRPGFTAAMNTYRTHSRVTQMLECMGDLCVEEGDMEKERAIDLSHYPFHAESPSL